MLKAYGGLDPAILLVRPGLRCHNTPYRFTNGVIVGKNVSHDDVLRARIRRAIAVPRSRCPEPFGVVAREATAAGLPGGRVSSVRTTELSTGGASNIIATLGRCPGNTGKHRAGCSSSLDDALTRKRPATSTPGLFSEPAGAPSRVRLPGGYGHSASARHLEKSVCTQVTCLCACPGLFAETTREAVLMHSASLANE